MRFVRPFVLIGAATLAACSAPAAPPLRPPHERRVVSLVPSLTEDLCAIGGAKQLVGVSSFSADVPCARGRSVVGDFASIDAEKVLLLRPDLVIGIASQARMTASLADLHLRVALFKDLSYDDLFADIRDVGALTGRTPAAGALIARLRARTAALQRQTRAFKRRPTVFVLLGTDPIFTAGANSYIATLVAIAGGRNAVGSLPGGYAQYGAEALLRLQPDAIVTDPSMHVSDVLNREPWRSLRAVRAGRVWTLPDPAILERPGPRYDEGIAWLVEHLRTIAT